MLYYIIVDILYTISKQCYLNVVLLQYRNNNEIIVYRFEVDHFKNNAFEYYIYTGCYTNHVHNPFYPLTE